jgi:hypothetical protein
MSTQNASTQNASAGALAFWFNPWLITLLVLIALDLIVGAIIYNANEPNPYLEQTPGDAAGQALGVGLLYLGGFAVAGWLVACAICWQIAHANRE